MASIKELGDRFAWAAALKPGDEVAIPSRNYGDAPHVITKVAKQTATQVVLEGDRRFAKKDLYEVGGQRSSWRGRANIVPVTDEIRVARETWELVQWLNQVVTDHGTKFPPLDVMRAMKVAHDAAIKEESC